ncbi:MAG: hypothetical protein HPY52_10615 [Firmicutes bacterium]|nr:hypothetical protein [Bacillota bacterium]
MYTRVESRFWQDEKMRAVSDDARYLMLYFLTSPHRNIIGFYFLPLPYACFDLGWDEKRFHKGLQELLQTGRVKYDADAHVVFIQNYLKHNPLENPNQVKSAIEKLEEIPQTQLFQDFLAVLEQCEKQFVKPLVERLQQRLRQPGTGTGTVTGTGSTYAPPGGAPEQPPKDPLEQEKQPGEQRKRAKTPADDKLFEQFWTAYPKKRSKGQAEKAWAKLQPDEQLVETMLAAIERAKTSEEWRKEGGRYIPYPATWLNAKGWEDDYRPLEVINGGRSQKHRGYPQGEDDYSDFVVR